MIPEPWEFALLALAAWRVWKLIGDDTILDRPRDWLLTRTGEKLDLFVVCPYCSGFWVALAWWLAWLAVGDWAIAAAVPWALSAVVGLLGSTWGAIAE